MFRRRRRGEDRPGDVPADLAVDPIDAGVEETLEPAVAASSGLPGLPAMPGLPPRPEGPWDLEEVTDEFERFDLGGLRLLVPDGAQVQLEMSPDGTVLPTIFIGAGAVQVSAFAAPRRSGIWDEIRVEIAEALQAGGGAAEEAEGPFGTELHAHVPVQLPDGQAALQPARFVGVDGPRWFLRGLFTGAAAADPAEAAPLEEALRGTVVVRGRDAMAPRDPLPINVPREVLDAAGVPEEQGQQPFEPFERGPEITEIH